MPLHPLLIFLLQLKVLVDDGFVVLIIVLHLCKELVRGNWMSDRETQMSQITIQSEEKKKKLCQHIPLALSLGRPKPDNREFEANLGYILGFCLKGRKKKMGKGRRLKTAQAMMKTHPTTENLHLTTLMTGPLEQRCSHTTRGSAL